MCRAYAGALLFGIMIGMPSFPAKIQNDTSDPKQVVFVVYPDIVLLDLVGPLQVFTHARHQSGESSAYKTAIVSLAGGEVETNTLVSIDSEPISSWIHRPVHTLVVVGGDGAHDVVLNRKFVEQIAALAAGAERVCSVCSGALVLAATGILNGRRAVTHWEDCEHLAHAFPEVIVEIDPIFVKDGHVWTSAGITAGIDLALAVVAEDNGRSAALEMARSLVTYMVRPGGQSQFSPVLDQQARDTSGRFADLHEWIADNLHRDLRVEHLAERKSMSARNFARLYTSLMKVTPAKAVETMRTQAARELLLTTDLGVKEIAGRCGFKDDERMRRAFIRALKVSPTEYRQRFQMA